VLFIAHAVSVKLLICDITISTGCVDACEGPGGIGTWFAKTAGSVELIYTCYLLGGAGFRSTDLVHWSWDLKAKIKLY